MLLEGSGIRIRAVDQPAAGAEEGGAAVTNRADDEAGTKRRPTTAIVAVLALCGTAVALQQTMVVPLLPEFPRSWESAPTTRPGWSPPPC